MNITHFFTQNILTRSRIITSLAIHSFLLTMALLLLNGCSESTHKDSVQQGIIFQKALAAYHAGNYTESLKLFEQSSLLNTDNPNAYLYAALICDSAVMNHDKARQYYERFLKLSPDTEKKEMVKNWMSKSAVSTKDESQAASEAVENLQKKTRTLSGELKQLTKKLQDKNADFIELKQRFEQATSMIDTLKQDLHIKESLIVNLNEELDAAKTRRTETDNNAQTFLSDTVYKSTSLLEPPKMNAQPPRDLFLKHLVAEGDTLPDIAEKFYGDSAQWRILWEANRFQLQDTSVKPGQILIIPPKPIETSKISR